MQVILSNKKIHLSGFFKYEEMLLVSAFYPYNL